MPVAAVARAEGSVEISPRPPVVTITLTRQIISVLPTKTEDFTASRMTLLSPTVSSTSRSLPTTSESDPEPTPMVNYTTIHENANNSVLIAVICVLLVMVAAILGGFAGYRRARGKPWLAALGLAWLAKMKPKHDPDKKPKKKSKDRSRMGIKKIPRRRPRRLYYYSDDVEDSHRSDSSGTLVDSDARGGNLGPPQNFESDRFEPPRSDFEGGGGGYPPYEQPPTASFPSMPPPPPPAAFPGPF